MGHSGPAQKGCRCAPALEKLPRELDPASVSAISTAPTPWFWGINGTAGVLAASVAIVTSMAISIDTTLKIGVACYLLVAHSRHVAGIRRRATQS
jgi:hypothetical protein